MADLELRGLKGLRELKTLEQSHKPNNSITKLQLLSVDSLEPGKYQPRKIIEDDSLTELADSIKTQGVIQPIIVREVESRRYEIIAGERRWRAAKKAGLKEIPVIIRNVENNIALAFGLVENIQREDLNPIEEALAFSQLRDEFLMSHADIAEMVGRSRTSVTNILRLLSLDDMVKSWLQAGELEMGHARALLSLEQAQQIKCARNIIDKKMSVRQAEKLVQAINKPQERKVIGIDLEFENKINIWKTNLSKQLLSKVNINFGSEGKGRMVIHFDSLEEADWLMEHVGFLQKENME